MSQFPGINIDYIHVTKRFVEKAMTRARIPLRNGSRQPSELAVLHEAEAVGGRIGEIVLSKEMAWLLLLLVPEGTDKKDVYAVWKSKSGTSCISANTYNVRLAKIRNRFPPECFDEGGSEQFCRHFCNLVGLTDAMPDKNADPIAIFLKSWQTASKAEKQEGESRREYNERAKQDLAARIDLTASSFDSFDGWLQDRAGRFLRTLADVAVWFERGPALWKLMGGLGTDE
jgi:hypothetical protein